ncbi:MAG: hypothetical protein IPP46_19225 [Bacteroidetes bacterium]|nr:hypothetical protein [Bacteroidota bacterium]
MAWGKPVDIDPTQMPGPYRYELQRADASGNFVTIATFTDLNDTTYNDNGLNTTAVQYRYRVQFWNDTPAMYFQPDFRKLPIAFILLSVPEMRKII